MRRKPASVPCAITRREALRTMGCGFGTVGLAATLGESALRAAPRAIVPGPLDPKPPHFAAKAKQVIFLYNQCKKIKGWSKGQTDEIMGQFFHVGCKPWMLTKQEISQVLDDLKN